MKRAKSYINSVLFFLLIITICPTGLFADTVAFGYFTNNSENRGLDYLKQVLPNSFASALKNKFNVNTIKPSNLVFLNSEDNIYAGRMIEEHELLSISPFLGADYFVYGSYEPLSGNRIRLTIKIYKTYNSRVFSFIEEGQLETEIFRLVDRISYQIKNIASNSMLYRAEPIAGNSRVGIITNIAGEDLNILYYFFLKNGYRISSLQGNELSSMIDHKKIETLSTVYGTNAYYDIISDRSSIELSHGTWSGAEYYKGLLQQKNTYNKFAFNFNKISSDLTARINTFKPDLFDYFIIIGFDEDKEKAWIRCISIKNNRLILTESGISGNSIDEISEKIIKSLATELPKKF